MRLIDNSQLEELECDDFGNICYLPIYYGNIRSIPAKTDFRSSIAASLYLIFCFTETWLNKWDDNDSYFPSGFNVFRQDRKTNGGGVSILVHEKFVSYQMQQIFDEACESVCVKIELKPIPLVIYVAYINKPDAQIFAKHVRLVQSVMSMETQSRVVVLGYFNLHDIVWNLDESETYFLPQDTESVFYQTAQEFLHTMHQLPMFQLSNIKNIASNVLDLVFVNATDDIQMCAAPVAITKVAETDVFHPQLEISFEYEVGEHAVTPNETIEIYLYKKGKLRAHVGKAE